VRHGESDDKGDGYDQGHQNDDRCQDDCAGQALHVLRTSDVELSWALAGRRRVD
jgi:hypothetical protein